MSRPFASEDTFRAAAHPARRKILEMLLRRELTVGEISQAFRQTRATISEHLRMLRHAGLISCHRRGTSLVYRLHIETLQDARAWFGQFDPARSRRIRAASTNI
jgi:DNA-binding transcriptional ArsR family regulator